MSRLHSGLPCVAPSHETMMPHNNAGDTVLTKYEKGTPQNPHNTASGNNLFGIASQTAMQNG